jgi:phospholipid N-methyltransferase
LYGLDWNKIDTIVELGPGSGTFTAEIISRCKPTAKIILIELEDSYVSLLQP